MKNGYFLCSLQPHLIEHNSAARGGHTDVVEMLLEHCNPNIRNDKMQAPLHFAAFKKNCGCVKALLNNSKTDVFILDRKGRTPREDTSSEEIREMIEEKQESKKDECER